MKRNDFGVTSGSSALPCHMWYVSGMCPIANSSLDVVTTIIRQRDHIAELEAEAARSKEVWDHAYLEIEGLQLRVNELEAALPAQGQPAAPDLSCLERYGEFTDYDMDDDPYDRFGPDKYGEYVRFDAVEALLASLPAAPAVKVKPLVWIEGATSYAETPIGTYSFSTGPLVCVLYVAGSAAPVFVTGGPEAAKAAAQADYEARILSALEGAQ